jgi:hypothetical protein
MSVLITTALAGASVLAAAMLVKRRADKLDMASRPKGVFAIEGETLSLIDEHMQRHDFKIIDVLQKGKTEYLMLSPGAGDSDEILIMKCVDEAIMVITNEKEFESVITMIENSRPVD